MKDLIILLIFLLALFLMISPELLYLTNISKKIIISFKIFFSKALQFLGVIIVSLVCSKNKY